MVALHPYPRGFLIHEANTAPTVPAEWSTVTLGSSGWLFTHDRLYTPELVMIADTDQWVLVHGLCLHAGLEDVDVSPAQHLAQMVQRGEIDFLEALDYLGGRHVILLGDSNGFKLFHDATGMRSVYFSPESSMVASHVHLITDSQSHVHRSDDQGRRAAIAGWDRTHFVGITSLLPNHFLKVADWTVQRFYPREVNRFSDLSTAEKVQAFRGMWNREMHNLVATGSKLVMSLTGGADSRTSLALSMDHVNDIEMFTYTVASKGSSTWSKSMALDKQLVEEIKELVPVEHRYFFFGKKNLPRSKEIAQLLKKNTTQKHGHWLVPHYANAFPEDDVVHLRGNAYEIGRAYWGTNEWNNNLEGLERLYRMRTKKDSGYEPEESRKTDFERGMNTWEYNVPLHGYHLWDIFYWEVRSGRWLAEILNETDIAFETCVPMNVRAMVEITLAFSIQERSDGFFFSELINSGCPVLNFPGKNDPRNIYEQVRDEQAELAALHDTETRVALLQEFQVATEGGSTRSVTPDGNRFYIPRDDFMVGTTVTRRLRPVPGNGDLIFTVDSPYAKASAVGHWYYQVNVDGKPVARWDGAERRRPVHVTLGNVQPSHEVSVSIVALRDHIGAVSWEIASRARIMDVLFTESDATGALTIATDIPGSVFASDDCGVLSIHVDHLGDLTSRDFQEDSPRRVDLITKYCVIPLLVVRRSGADSTVIMCNGAVDQSLSQGKPVFQRSTWWREIDQHQIYVCDPATVGHEAVSLAWGQYSRKYWSVPDTARGVRAIANVLGSNQADQRAYFGSSAGGFLALALIYHDPDARAMINNAQFDWTRWYAPAVNKLRARRLKSMLPADLRTMYPLRTNVLNLLSTMNQGPRVDYWINTASDHDRLIDLPEFQQFAEQFPWIAHQMVCHQYSDEDAGHNPLSKTDTLRILAET